LRYKIGDKVLLKKEHHDGSKGGVILDAPNNRELIMFYRVMLQNGIVLNVLPSDILMEDDFDDPEQKYKNGELVRCVKLDMSPFWSISDYCAHRILGAVGPVTDFFNKDALYYDYNVYHVAIDGQTTVFWETELEEVVSRSGPVQEWLSANR
jgi:hypothetical protein